MLHPRYSWPLIPINRHVCTQGDVLAVGLPAKLSAAADALELENRKDAAGERLMHQMSKPRKPRKDEDPAGIYWFEDQERLDRLGSYDKQDVEVEREIYNRVPPLSAAEQRYGCSAAGSTSAVSMSIGSLPKLRVRLHRCGARV